MVRTRVSGDVRGPSASRAGVRFLLAGGATYTLLTLDAWTAVGLTPRRRFRLSLADGTVVERHVSECHIPPPEGDARTPVILGEVGDEAGDEVLLGTETRKSLGFVLNPFTSALQPMRMMRA